MKWTPWKTWNCTGKRCSGICERVLRMSTGFRASERVSRKAARKRRRKDIFTGRWFLIITLLSVILHPTSYILHSTFYINCHPSSVICHPSYILHSTSSIICHPSSVIRHLSSVNCHPSSSPVISILKFVSLYCAHPLLQA